MKRLYFVLILAIITSIDAMSGSYSRQLSPYARQAARSLITAENCPLQIKNKQLQAQTTSLALARNAQVIKLNMPQQQFVRTLHTEPTQKTEIPKFNTNHSEHEEEPSFTKRIIDFARRNKEVLAAGAGLGFGPYAWNQQEPELIEKKEVIEQKLAGYKEELPEALLKYYINNIATVNPYVIKSLFEHYPEEAKAVAPLILESILKSSDDNTLQDWTFNPLRNNDWSDLFKVMIETNPSMIEELFQSIADDLKSETLTVLVKLFCECSHAQNVLKDKIIKCPNTFSPFSDLQKDPTQSKQHIISNLISKYLDLSSQGDNNYQDDLNLQVMTRELIDLECAEQKKGRYTFMHGQSWFHHFYQEIYTDLWSIINHPVQNYRFIRYSYKKQPSIEKSRIIRNKYLQGDVGWQYAESSHTFHTLFVNYALFTNKSSYENTSSYIRNGRSISDPKLNYLLFIHEFELYNYLNEAELNFALHQMRELESEHKKLNKFGSGIFLSISPESIGQCVFPCASYGKKRTVNIEGIGETSDPKIILDMLRTTPEKIHGSDDLIFVCVLTHDLALKPNNGIDIYDFNPADKEKLAAWRAKKDKLINWIKERVEQKRAAKAASTQPVHT